MIKTIYLVIFAFIVTFALSAQAATIDFEITGGVVDNAYSSLGISFNPSDQMIVDGISLGDPGNWDLEGTNGPRFLGFNDPYTMELTFDNPQQSISLDVSRSNGSSPGQTFTINAYDGATLLDTQTVTLGNINSWTTVSITTPGFNRVTWDTSGTGFSPYGVDNIVFSQSSVSVPTMTEWGMIIFIVLAGLGSIYYLRRQRRAKS